MNIDGVQIYGLPVSLEEISHQLNKFNIDKIELSINDQISLSEIKKIKDQYKIILSGIHCDLNYLNTDKENILEFCRINKVPLIIPAVVQENVLIRPLNIARHVPFIFSSLIKIIDRIQEIGLRKIIIPMKGKRFSYFDKQFWEFVAEEINLISKDGVQVGYHNHRLEWLKLGKGQKILDILHQNLHNEIFFQIDISNLKENKDFVIDQLNPYFNRIQSYHLKITKRADENFFQELLKNNLNMFEHKKIIIEFDQNDHLDFSSRLRWWINIFHQIS